MQYWRPLFRCNPGIENSGNPQSSRAWVANLQYTQGTDTQTNIASLVVSKICFCNFNQPETFFVSINHLPFFSVGVKENRSIILADFFTLSNILDSLDANHILDIKSDNARIARMVEHGQCGVHACPNIIGTGPFLSILGHHFELNLKKKYLFFKEK